MNHDEFEQFVHDNGKGILRFCRMTCGDRESGDELYQETMLKLLGKCRQLDPGQNIRSYALSVSLLLWKNQKKKLANRERILPMGSMEQLEEEGNLNVTDRFAITPENHAVLGEEIQIVREAVAGLPEKYRVPIYLYYSADLSVAEIAEVLMIPAGTVKSRMNKAKQLLKKELEVLRYDR